MWTRIKYEQSSRAHDHKKAKRAGKDWIRRGTGGQVKKIKWVARENQRNQMAARRTSQRERRDQTSTV